MISGFAITIFIWICVVNIHGAVVPKELNSLVRKAVPGQIVNISNLSINQATDILNSNALNSSFESISGGLIYSDDPETAKGYGILYSDTLDAGIQRLYIYHVNGLSANAKITAVVTNPSASQTAHLKFIRKAVVAPSVDYLAVGAAGVKAYYTNTYMPSPLSIPPTSSMVLDVELDNIVVSYEELVGAIFDVDADATLTFSILMFQSGTDTLRAFEDATYPTKDGEHRLGTFSENKKISPQSAPYAYLTSSGASYFEIASNPKYTHNDMPLNGTSSFDNSVSTLAGNYGVEYAIAVDVSVDVATVDSLAILLNPRGGAYTGYIKVTSSLVSEAGKQLSSTVGQVIPIVTSSADAVVCAKIDVTCENMKDTVASSGVGHVNVLIEFMPAGSTSLPVWLLVMPLVMD